MKADPVIRARMILAAGIIGAASVALGAFGAHALSDVLPADRLALVDTASRYAFVHALALLATAALFDHLDQRQLRLIGRLFTVGVVLFSGSLAVLAVTGIGWLGAVTPFGGACFIAGWLLLGWSGSRFVLFKQ